MIKIYLFDGINFILIRDKHIVYSSFYNKSIMLDIHISKEFDIPFLFRIYKSNYNSIFFFSEKHIKSKIDFEINLIYQIYSKIYKYL